MSRPRVSVTMASYNHARFVRAAVESVLNQTFQDFEICITDDGSSDGTADAVRSIRDSRVSLQTFARNRGACLAMNASIDRARGEYIAILNSDDVFAQHKLERQVEFLDHHPECGAVFAYPSFIDENGGAVPSVSSFYGDLFRVQNRPRQDWLRHLFFSGNVFCHPTVLIRRKCYEEVGLYEPALAQLPDYDLWIRLLARYEVHVLPEELTRFRILARQDNVSAPRPEVRVRVQWEMTQLLARYLKFDDNLLCAVFPEIPKPASKDTSGIARRMAQRALVRIAGRGVVDDERLSAGTEPRRSTAWYLGELALAVGKPAHVLFGLNAMYEACDAQREQDARHLISLTGAFDIFGMLSGIPEQRRFALKVGPNR